MFNFRKAPQNYYRLWRSRWMLWLSSVLRDSTLSPAWTTEPVLPGHNGKVHTDRMFSVEGLVSAGGRMALQKMWSLTEYDEWLYFEERMMNEWKEPGSKSKQGSATWPPSENTQRPRPGWGCNAVDHRLGRQTSQLCLRGVCFTSTTRNVTDWYFYANRLIAEAIKGSTPRRTQECFRKTSRVTRCKLSLPWDGKAGRGPERPSLYFQDLKQTKIPGLEPEKIKRSQVWVHVEPSQVTGLWEARGREPCTLFLFFITSRRAEITFWPPFRVVHQPPNLKYVSSELRREGPCQAVKMHPGEACNKNSPQLTKPLNRMPQNRTSTHLIQNY